jgi:hypothetical protein
VAGGGAGDLSLAIVAGAAAVLAFDLLKPVPAVARALVPASRERSPP